MKWLAVRAPDKSHRQTPVCPLAQGAHPNVWRRRPCA